MAFAVSNKKSKHPKRVKESTFLNSILHIFLFRIPTTVLLLALIFLWSSSTTIITNNILHICVSSRKLGHLYCLSAGTQPNIHIPIVDNSKNSIPVFEKNTISVVEKKSSLDVEKHSILVVEKQPIPVVENINVKKPEEEDDELARAVKDVEQQLELHRSWASNSSSCNGKGLYVYDLPPKFNNDLLGQCNNMIPWVDFCNYFTNNAFGEPIPALGKCWYQTHQYSLELIFHSRVLKHPCRVYNENEAKLFYVPYYGGLDILRWHFKNVTVDVKDSLGKELVNWLELQVPWRKNNGKDHVFVLGKISWDFRRNSDLSWGTKFLEHEKMQEPMKILIERHPWQINDLGAPHPTQFHPQSDDDIIEWQEKIMKSSRKSLVGFAGAARPGTPENIRSMLIKQCKSAGGIDMCRFLNCSSGGCDRPEPVISLFMESEFCLQPPGDSPTRKSLFDSLISGCIPVLFDPFTAYYQYPWHLPKDHGKYSVFMDKEEVRRKEVDVVERLSKVAVEEREKMRRYIAYELLPGLVYGDPNAKFEKFQDAFSITMNNLLERVTRL